MKKALTIPKNWIEQDRSDFIRTFLYTGGFGFCLCASFICGYRLDRYGSVASVLPAVILCSLAAGLFFAVAAMYVLGYIAYRRTDTGSVATSGSGRVSVRLWLAVSLIVFLCMIPVWLAFYPGIFSYDAEIQLYQVLTGQYSTHHPLLHTLWMGACLKLMYDAFGMNAAVALYSISQMLIMSLMLGWTAAEIVRVRGRRYSVLIYIVFAALFPVHAMLAISTTKDVVFAGIMVVWALLVRRGVYDRRGFVLIAAGEALLVLFRSNASYALILMTACLIVTDIRRHALKDDRLFRALVAGLIAGALVSGGLKLICHADSVSPREALSVPIQQLSAVRSAHSDELDAETIQTLDTLLTPDAGHLYNPHLADPVKRVMNMREPVALVRTWIRLGLRYPGTYLDAWLLTTEGAWYIYDTSCHAIYGYGTGTGFGYLSTDTRIMPSGFEVTPASVLPGLKIRLEELVNGNTFEHIYVVRLLFSPALYVWIMWGCMCVASIRRREAFGRGFMIFPAYFITLLLGPAILVRYMYPYMIAPALYFFGDDRS